MSIIKRRSFLVCSSLGLPVWLGGCGGGQSNLDTSTEQALGTSPTPTPVAAPAPPPSPPEWNVKAGLTFVAGATGVVDLNNTLPTGVSRGGTFSVDSTGAPLPVGTTLSADGKLTIASVATVGMTAGIVFAYTTP